MPDNAFGERVALARCNAGLTQRALAEKLGLTRSTITNLERGASGTTTGQILAMADILDVTPGWLINAETATVPVELVAQMRKVRAQWEAVRDQWRRLGWPDQAECVSLPNAFVQHLDYLLTVAGKAEADAT